MNFCNGFIDFSIVTDKIQNIDIKSERNNGALTFEPLKYGQGFFGVDEIYSC